MYFTFAIILACTFYPIYAQVSFFCAYFCLPVGDRYAFYKRGLLWKMFATQKADMFLCLLFVDCSVLLAV